MIICSCKAVSDRTAHAAIADGATTVDQLQVRCGAGSKCGGCWPELTRLIEEHTARCDTVVAAVA